MCGDEALNGAQLQKVLSFSLPGSAVPPGEAARSQFVLGFFRRGNAFYTNPATKNTHVVNMIFSNSTVAWLVGPLCLVPRASLSFPDPT